jgi:hypothetical protein
MNALEYMLNKFNVPAGAALPIQVPMNRVPDEVGLFAELGYKVGAEIGVDRGLFAAEICKANPGVKLYGVDPWQPYEGYGEVYPQDYADQCRVEAAARLLPYNVVIMQMHSTEAAKMFGDGELDFVYIDGNHAYQYVLDDITAWSPKVRDGGLVCGHDYSRPKNRARWQFQGVIKAVNDYVAANSIAPWFILRGKGNSGWLWVKGN